MGEAIAPRRASKRRVGGRGNDGKTTRKGVRRRRVGKAGREGWGDRARKGGRESREDQVKVSGPRG